MSSKIKKKIKRKRSEKEKKKEKEKEKEEKLQRFALKPEHGSRGLWRKPLKPGALSQLVGSHRLSVRVTPVLQSDSIGESEPNPGCSLNYNAPSWGSVIS